MEHSVLLVIILLLGLAMASQLTPPCDAAQVPAQGQPIYDMDGHELTKDNLYQILSADPKMSDLCVFMGSSLTGADCPQRATVGWCGDEGGNLVIVRPAEASAGSVPRLSSNLLLTFNHTTNACMMELKWHVARFSGTRQMHVTTGHGLGEPEPLEKSFWFHAERHENGYKLVSCRKEPCRDVVLYDYEGYRWLTVEEDGCQPFVVMFKKCPWPCSS